jgi:ABC-type transport system substrate-binding protein
VLAAVLVWSPWSGSGASRAGGHGSGSSTDPSDESSTTASGGAAAGSDGSGTPGVEGGTVRLGLAGPVVVDPPFASAASPSDLMVLDLLYDGLTRRSTDGAIQPGVALTWAPDAAQRVWRFALDPNVRFTSGRSIVAADVVASLQHVMAAGDGSPAALRLEAVQGFRAYVDGTVPAVSGLRAIDDHTVEIVLDTPLAQLPDLLAAPPYGVVDVPGLAALAADPSAAPGSVAPTQLRTLDLTGSWLVGDAGESRLRLDRRPGAPGHLESIELHPFADGAAAFAAFEDEKVDWAPVPG